ncbi:hypothetical protein BMS3Bbin14_01767 [bacterium BMS3Bbin14]|nr:hypothetical protein BMS3Abin13_01635 [bacterium BMS3Abin13]GBE53278.1 hypothetical protein BMS3Bbin14_01767 [bacterium BMS3Bbin14]
MSGKNRIKYFQKSLATFGHRCLVNCRIIYTCCGTFYQAITCRDLFFKFVTSGYAAQQSIKKLANILGQDKVTFGRVHLSKHCLELRPKCFKLLL